MRLSLPRYRQKHLLILITIVAIAMWWARPPRVILMYSVEVPRDLPVTTSWSPGLGEQPQVVSAEQWYREWYRNGWQGYLSKFRMSPVYSSGEEEVEDEIFHVNVLSDGAIPMLPWAGIGDVGDRARDDGSKSCRAALRAMVETHGWERVQEHLKIQLPRSEDVANWKDFADLLAPGERIVNHTLTPPVE